ncbi:MAG: glycosyltransferase [Candidatus Dormibacteraeota bacterium]|nr:glycosyltransferase [Candidatus Dormibacteraeota bacterium]
MGEAVTICLAMIVRDEEKIIQRCLSSVRGLIDTWVIVDTGSEDRTPEVALETLDGIPGKWYSRPWVNFGHNRTELMELAHGKADYLLLLDADHEVSFGELPPLDADSYHIRHTGNLEYWVKRLVRGDRRWWYVGSTHEYITTTENPPERNERLDAITIREHYDGGRRHEKFQRDLGLLRADDQNDTRVTFYLANTLRDLKETDEAVATYKRRAAMGGWEEEVFYSLYEAGRLADDFGLLFEAWSFRPQRIEPLYELAWRFRSLKQWPAAHLVAKRGLGAPVPSDSLFVHRWIYDWGIEFEYSIAAYWVGEREESRKACDRLLANPDLPENYRGQTALNRAYTVQ